MTRSLRFVPGDSPAKFDKALRSGADAVIIDLEDAVAAGRKAAARRNVLALLQSARPSDAPRIYVRINALSTPFAEGDLDVVMTGAPDAIVLPKASGGSDVALLAARLSLREALHNIPDGSTGILPLATESAAAVFGLGTYKDASPRLVGLTWGAEDLSTDIGATATRVDGLWTSTVQTVRSLTLFGAVAAGVSPIDTVYADFRDLSGLAQECATAARDGFTGKLAIHPDQVEVINAAFTPSEEAIRRAEGVVAAFATAGDVGVVAVDGTMLDRPHLAAAQRLLDRVNRGDVEAMPEATTAS
jgi:citrate lyase subunit beta/citryl-CoA lyase